MTEWIIRKGNRQTGKKQTRGRAAEVLEMVGQARHSTAIPMSLDRTAAMSQWPGPCDQADGHRKTDLFWIFDQAQIINSEGLRKKLEPSHLTSYMISISQDHKVTKELMNAFSR
jgi:hypothetical protein